MTPTTAMSPLRASAGPRVPAIGVVVAVDVALVLAGALAALATRDAAGWTATAARMVSVSVPLYVSALLAGFGVAVYAVFTSVGLYDAARVRRWPVELLRVVPATGMLAALAIAVSHPAVALPVLVRVWVGSAVAVAAGRGLRAWLTRAGAASRSRRVVIVGSGPHGRDVCRQLSVDLVTRYEVLGFVDTSESPRSRFITRRTLGPFEALEAILVREHVDEVHIALPARSHYRQIEDTIRTCERIGVKATYGVDVFGTGLAQPCVESGGRATPRVELRVVAEGWPLGIKRAIDVAVALVGLVALSPLLVAIAVAVRLTSQGPVIFAQERFGLNRRRFRMLKFRTMVDDAERLQATLETRNEARGPVFKIARDPRVTRIGRWLRRTSIDELPQLVNVLTGEMSLVGPRPLPARDVAQFTRPADMRRFSVNPGLTGLWQVSGRSQLGFDQWITLDLRYIDTWSLALDARILARTVPAVLRGTGAA